MEIVKNIHTGKIHQVAPREFWQYNKKEDFVASTYEEFEQQEEEVITFLCTEFHGHDEYYEDEEGREQHTLEGEPKVYFYDVSVWDAKKFLNEYSERNADNPPYDSYSVRMAYWKKSRVIVDLRQFEETKGDE